MRALLEAYYSTFANTIYLSPFFISERQVKVGLKTRSSLGVREVKKRFLRKQREERKRGKRPDTNSFASFSSSPS